MWTKTFAAILGACVLTLGGCAATAMNKPVMQSNGVFLSGEAQAALDQAKIDVARAREQRALWTTAQTELERAEADASRGDSPAVITHAHQASQLARLGIEQLALPSTEPFK